MLPPRTKPRIIPVLDVMGGHVVRAVAGRRDEYRPIASKLTVSTYPVAVAHSLAEYTGASELYVADLDAIRGGEEMSPQVVRLLHEVQLSCWVDIGITSRRPATLLPDLPWVWPVMGLETGAEPHHLADTLAVVGNRPVAVSLDLKAGVFLGKWEAWGAMHDRDAQAVARTAIASGVTTLIVLDLARVGVGTGTGTEPLLRAIRAEFPDVELIAGGGVRNWEDFERLGEAGADGVLVASALHDGSLSQLP